MKVDFANLPRQYNLYKKDIDLRMKQVMDKCNFIMGEEVGELEARLSEFTGAKHSIACSNGTDAIQLALMALDIKDGDEVITTPFTFIATAEMIAKVGAKPVFVDISLDDYNIDAKKIEAKITEKTKAIMPVSLYGQTADMDAINKIGKLHNIVVIEDAAQSFGAIYKGKKSCNLSKFATTSFFPAKSFGCYGDGGAVFTDDLELANKVKSLRLHGQSERYYHKYIGIGGRLDTLQAAVLLAKLPYYEKEIKDRNEIAGKYTKALSDISELLLPDIKSDRLSVFAQYSIRSEKREKILAHLKNVGIPTAIHYPKPLHLQECFAYLNYKVGDFPISEQVANDVFSIPMNAFLSDEEINYVVKNIRDSLA